MEIFHGMQFLVVVEKRNKHKNNKQKPNHRKLASLELFIILNGDLNVLKGLSN